MASLAKQSSAIRAARLKRKLTQAEVAAELGVTKATVSGWENGHYRPGADNALDLSKLLRISVEQVLSPREA